MTIGSSPLNSEDNWHANDIVSPGRSNLFASEEQCDESKIKHGTKRVEKYNKLVNNWREVHDSI